MITVWVGNSLNENEEIVSSVRIPRLGPLCPCLL